MSWRLPNVNKPKKYTLHEGSNLVLVNYDGLDVDARQVVEAYDTRGRYRTGLIVTDVNIKSMSLALRKRKDIYKLANHKITCDELSKENIVKKIITLYEKY